MTSDRLAAATKPPKGSKTISEEGKVDIDMKKIHFLSVALLAIFAFAALTAVSASAVTFLLATWLVNGSPVESELSVTATGELELEDTKAVLGIAAGVLCSGVLDGSIGTNSSGKINELLSLTGTLIAKELGGELLTCTNIKNCAEPLVLAVNLGWETEVELMEDEGVSSFVELLLPHAGGGNVGWEVECMSTKLTDTCTTAMGVAELKLEGATLNGIFSEAITELAGLKLANCTLGGAETGKVAGSGIIAVAGGGELMPSSEGDEG